MTDPLPYDGTGLPPEESESTGGTPMQEWSPDDHTVAEVQEYLAEADEAERSRVLSLEAQGKARKTILGEGSTSGQVDVEYVHGDDTEDIAAGNGPGEDTEATD